MSAALRVVNLIERCNARAEIAFLVSGVTETMGAQFCSHLAITAVAEFARNRGMHFWLPMMI